MLRRAHDGSRRQLSLKEKPTYKGHWWSLRTLTLVANPQLTHSVSLVDPSHLIQSCSTHLTCVLSSLSSLPLQPLSSQRPIVAQNSRYTPVQSHRDHADDGTFHRREGARMEDNGYVRPLTTPALPFCNLTGTSAESESRTLHPCMLSSPILFVISRHFNPPRYVRHSPLHRPL